MLAVILYAQKFRNSFLHRDLLLPQALLYISLMYTYNLLNKGLSKRSIPPSSWILGMRQRLKCYKQSISPDSSFRQHPVSCYGHINPHPE